MACDQKIKREEVLMIKGLKTDVLI